MSVTRLSKFILCLLLFTGNSSVVFCQTVEKQSVLTVLTVNLARFSSWPKRSFDKYDPLLNLCVIGDNIVQDSFLKMNNKKINGKKVNIINVSRLRNLSICQLIYISEIERSVLTQILFELKNQPILTVGENLEFVKAGGMVGLEKTKRKMKLNINLPIIKQSEMSISSRILKLANIVDFPILEGDK